MVFLIHIVFNLLYQSMHIYYLQDEKILIKIILVYQEVLHKNFYLIIIKVYHWLEYQECHHKSVLLIVHHNHQPMI